MVLILHKQNGKTIKVTLSDTVDKNKLENQLNNYTNRFPVETKTGVYHVEPNTIDDFEIQYKGNKEYISGRG